MSDEPTSTSRLAIKKLTLSDSIDSDSVAMVMKAIHEANEKASAERIELWLNTLGGSIRDGLALIDTMMLSPIEVDVVAVGSCMSMGIAILQAGSRRYATTHTRLMIHPARVGTGLTRVPEMLAQAKDGERLEKQMNKFVANRVGLTHKRYKKLMGDANFLSPETAKELGFIDEVRQTKW